MAGAATKASKPTERARIRTGPQFAFTREGRVFVVATVGIGVAAVNTGNNLLYLVLGLMLGLLLTSGVLSEVVLRRMRIERTSAPRLFAGRPALFELGVTNDKRWLSSTSFELCDVADGDERDVTGYVLKLEAGATARVVMERTPRTRGVLRATHVRIRTRFPFGILEKTRTRRSEASCIVFPELVPVTLPDASPQRSGVQVPTATSGQGSEIVGIRDHREGDAMRDVHWRRSASLGRTVVRDRASERDENLDILLDPRIGVGPEARRAFERSVSEAASLAVLAIADDRPVVVRTPEGPLARAHSRGDLDGVLRALAMIEPSLDEPREERS